MQNFVRISHTIPHPTDFDTPSADGDDLDQIHMRYAVFNIFTCTLEVPQIVQLEGKVKRVMIPLKKSTWAEIAEMRICDREPSMTDSRVIAIDLLHEDNAAVLAVINAAMVRDYNNVRWSMFYKHRAVEDFERQQDEEEDAHTMAQEAARKAAKKAAKARRKTKSPVASEDAAPACH